MSVTNFDDQTEGQLREIVARRHHFVQDLPRLQGLLRRRRRRDVPDDRLAKRAGRDRHGPLRERGAGRPAAAALLAEGKTGPEWHEPSRPEAVEAEGTKRFATFLENTGASGYIVHLSCEPALRRGQAARLRGVSLAVESVIPHFMLDKTYAERPGVEGMKHVMSPPLRDKRNQAVLWKALADGSIDTVGTDHCPFDTAQKLMGRDAFTQIPNGIPGHRRARQSALHLRRVARSLDIHRFVDAASTRAAQAVRPVPAQGHDRGRQRRGPGGLRPDVPRHDLGGDAARQQRLQRVRGHGHRRPPVAWSPCAGKVQVQRRAVRRRSQARPPAAALTTGPSSPSRRRARRADHAFTWGPRRLTLFAELTNILNHQNVRNVPYAVDRAGRVYDATDTLLPFVPSAGLLIEF